MTPRFVFLPLARGDSIIVDAHKAVFATSSPDRSGVLVELATGEQFTASGTVEQIAATLGTLKIIAGSAIGAAAGAFHINPRHVRYFEEIAGPSIVVHLRDDLKATVPGGDGDALMQILVQLKYDE